MGTPVASLDDAIRRIRDAEAEIRTLGVERLALFGSVLRGTAGPASDADLLVQFRLAHTRLETSRFRPPARTDRDALAERFERFRTA